MDMDTLLKNDTVSIVLKTREQDDFSSSSIANIISLSRHKIRQCNLNDTQESVRFYNDFYYNVVNLPTFMIQPTVLKKVKCTRQVVLQSVIIKVLACLLCSVRLCLLLISIWINVGFYVYVSTIEVHWQQRSMLQPCPKKLMSSDSFQTDDIC